MSRRPILRGTAQARPLPHPVPRGRLPISLHDARTIIDAVADVQGGHLVSPTRYLLWGMDCPQNVMAAYERSVARNFGMLQADGDLLVSWAVQQSLLQGDFELGIRIREALEAVGWQPKD